MEPSRTQQMKARKAGNKSQGSGINPRGTNDRTEHDKGSEVRTEDSWFGQHERVASDWNALQIPATNKQRFREAKRREQ